MLLLQLFCLLVYSVYLIFYFMCFDASYVISSSADDPYYMNANDNVIFHKLLQNK